LGGGGVGVVGGGVAGELGDTHGFVGGEKKTDPHKRTYKDGEAKQSQEVT